MKRTTIIKTEDLKNFAAELGDEVVNLGCSKT